jgi:hypothetical protein
MGFERGECVHPVRRVGCLVERSAQELAYRRETGVEPRSSQVREQPRPIGRGRALGQRSLQEVDCCFRAATLGGI